jgi:hypothetical protein
MNENQFQTNSLRNVAGVKKTATVLRPVGTAGTITAGKSSVSIANVHTANQGTVNGVTLKFGETLNFDAGGISNTLNAIKYDCSNSEFLIIIIE